MTLYKKYTMMRTEILKHKWIESEKVKRDIGFEFCLIDWIKKHRMDWIKSNIDSKAFD